MPKFVISISCLALFIGLAVCSVHEPNGATVPVDSGNGEEQLYTFFQSRGENIDWINSAFLEPSSFVPSNSLNIQFVLQQAGDRPGFYWYNVDTPSQLYQLLAPGTTPPHSTSFNDIISSSNYHGGNIGFAIYQGGVNPAHYSQNTLNPSCTSCNPVSPWILCLIYQSTVTPNAYYIAYEDGGVSGSSFGNDGDFNDDVFLVTGITNAAPPSQQVAICGNGIVEGAEQCDGGACCSSTCTFVSGCGPTTGVSSVCGNGIVEANEQCDGGACCTTTCTFSSTAFVCRSSAGVCDVPETCTGSSASCPANVFQSSSTVCGTQTGPCDIAAQCSGSSASCPSNSFRSTSTVCRASAGVCDVSETCTGSSASCPADSFQSSSTVCGTQTGPCDIAAQCSGSSASCPSNPFQSSSTVCRASVGPCDPSESCTGSSATCPADENGSFETSCPGLSLASLGTSFTYYDVIAFGDFTANTGDIEQRLAVGGDFTVGNGWSVGFEINGDDGAVGYSLVVNGDASFGSGDVYPDGSGYPSNYPQEDLFVGGAFTGESYLASRVTGCAGGVGGCLSSQFSAAQSCYGGFQSALANNADNVQHLIQWSGLYVTCNDVNANEYFLTLTASEMNFFTWTSLTSCNYDAKWIINVVGTDDVTFNGGSFPAPSNQVLWNIQGSGRTINVGWTQVDGSILAPYNNVNQPSGVVIGKVIANNIVSLQINKYQCFA